MTTYTFEAIGTTWQIDIQEKFSLHEQKRLLKKIETRIEEFDRAYSRFRSDSLVTKMSQIKGKYKLPSDAKPLLSLYEKLYGLTNGLFTPLIGQVLVDAGYDAEYSLKEHTLTKPKELREVFTYNHPILEMKEPALLDFGAAGKGYLIDIIGELLEGNGMKSYCIDAGGDIRYRNYSKKPLRVGLENPENLKQVLGVVPLFNQSICASAGNRRKWGKFHHIFHPALLAPVNGVLATWVIADTTLLADALSTCLFLIPEDVLYKEYKFEYFILYPDYSVQTSKGFNKEWLFLT